jgi:DNA-binding XRE family transcriptional regulator
VDRATPEPGSGVPATEKATAKQAAKTSAGLLKDARKKASLSRPDAARELLVDPDTIKKHEEGKAFPRSALRAAYATLYKKSENELFPIVP